MLGPLPLEVSQEPPWFTALSEEAQEQLWDRWWQDLVSWLSHEGATVIMVELTTLDFEMASAGGFRRVDRWRWRADWKPGTAAALYRMNPEWAVVRSGTRQLFSMFETWDGVTTEQDLRPPYFAEDPPEPIVQAAGVDARTARDNVRKGLKFALVSTAFIAYLIIDPDWPFLVSTVVFTMVVPSLAWLTAAIVYPEDDQDLPVPIDRGSDKGFAIYLEA
ncbi:hypothetical protein AB1046_13605 [Promicromonospora sp. Populi]|uniref:hypothetical protein n=1 Tax=Promicromonospora sp. Populi TaxID=3239420 RepID=UPI0034E269D0